MRVIPRVQVSNGSSPAKSVSLTAFGRAGSYLLPRKKRPRVGSSRGWFGCAVRETLCVVPNNMQKRRALSKDSRASIP